MTTTSTRVEDARLREMMAACEGVTPGPWLYRPYEHDDWGWVRGGPLDEDGRLWAVAHVRAGRYLTDDDYDAHRAAKTDPYGANALHIANCDPETIRSILSELLELREAISLIREEAGKDNAPFGRSDGLALNRIRIALEMSGRSLSQGAGHEQ